MSTNTIIGQEAVYDARTLGKPKMLLLGFQHMFAMFGATVVVPLITGLDVQTTLLMAGLGTLLFHTFTKFRVPAFLGSSFAFIGGYTAVAGAYSQCGVNDYATMLPYACLGVACAGLIYVILAAIIKSVGVEKVMRFFPPVVTGPIIIAIGLCLAPSALNNCASNWFLAICALAIVIVLNIWGKGIIKIIPILIGVAGAYIIALIFGNGLGLLGDGGNIDLESIRNAAWFGLPVAWNKTIFGGVDFSNSSALSYSIMTMVPISLATMMEHIGDICAISATCQRDYINNPGLHRTLIGDGLATTFSSLFGGPANTTYGENTGVLALSKVYDPKVVRIAAVLAIAFSFSPKFAAVIEAMPSGIIGGVSFMLYGSVAAVGIRNLIEAKVDFSQSRNVIVAGVIIICALGVKFSSGLGADVVNGVDGAITLFIGTNAISFSGLAIASIVGILLNAIFPESIRVKELVEETAQS